jgi:hypothetical protein
MLNRAAPGFFWMVQVNWWNDILLHICRMTDERTGVLSVLRLANLVKVGLRDEVKARLTRVEAATKSARDTRDRYIAHRNIDVMLDRAARPLADTDREAIFAAIQAIDDLLHFVDNHFTQAGPIMYGHLDIRGGAKSILDIVERGLRDRDRQFEFTPNKPY